MGQSIQTGLTQTEITRDSTVTYVTVTDDGSVGSTVHTVPAGKKWTVVSWNMYSRTTGGTALYLKSRLMCKSLTANETINGSGAFVLAAGESIQFTITDVLDFLNATYYEEDA